MKAYGFNFQRKNSDQQAAIAESLKINGFVIVRDVLDKDRVAELSHELDRLYDVQEAKYPDGYLTSIQEDGLVRAPLVESELFLELANNHDVLQIVRAQLGNFVQLHLQNGILNWANRTHHQRSWHRDLPYQNFEISRPLAISALYSLDDFTVQSGGTEILPFSHREEMVPSDEYIEENTRSVEVSAGSAIIFDSMMVHRAGVNTSADTRRAVNHVYTVPLLKQQIDLPSAMGDRNGDDEQMQQLLGYAARVPHSERDLRERRAKKN